MSKRKYKILIDIVLVLLCLVPVLLVIINTATSHTLLTSDQISTIINGVSISDTMSATISNALEASEIALDGSFGGCISVIISNALMVHIVYLFIEVIVFVPKFAIKALNMFTGGKD